MPCRIVFATPEDIEIDVSKLPKFPFLKKNKISSYSLMAAWIFPPTFFLRWELGDILYLYLDRTDKNIRHYYMTNHGTCVYGGIKIERPEMYQIQ